MGKGFARRTTTAIALVVLALGGCSEEQQAMAQDALALLDRLGWVEPRSVHLVGLSMGGMITQELAQQGMLSLQQLVIVVAMFILSL